MIENLLKGLAKRWLANTPWWGQVSRIVGAVLAVIIGLPTLIATNQEYLCSEVNICFVLPEVFETALTKVVGVASLLAALLSDFAVDEVAEAKKGK